MQGAKGPITYDLVLIGGGHSHGIALKLWGMNPLPGVRLTLISDTSHTPYSGMLPGYVAGFYSFDETHIDLRHLARFAQAQFYQDRAINLNLANNKVICANHPPVAFDFLSIDIGSTPATESVTGAAKYAVPAKPVPQFLEAWHQIITRASQYPEKSLRIAVVGGGAGGVELILNMQTRLHTILQKAQQPLSNISLHLVHRGSKLLSHHNAWVSQRLQNILLERGIQLHLQERVEAVSKIPLEEEAYQIICQSGLTLEVDYLIWVTQASAPGWIKGSGLATDSQGFILVKDTLQSLSHPHIFAAGDIATMENYTRPKAGVFAVRQGKPLFANLQRIVERKPLKPYFPQQQYLSLIGTGNKTAIASWSFLGWESPLLWRWKDYIDRQFMVQFSNLPPMEGESSRKRRIIQNQTRCAGCGSKVGAPILERVLSRLEIAKSSDVIMGIDPADDAAVVRVNSEQLLVHTIDFFPSLINDPFIFGQITANHCLSDLFAMGATPKTALVVATVPYSLEEKVEETLYQLLSGVIEVLQKHQTCLIGGHTTEGAELALGLSCNGLVFPDQLLRKSELKSGQVLILNKGVGTGTLFAAEMQGRGKGRWIDSAVESMSISNQKAAQIFIQYGATACTDITGFGLLGHLLEMIKVSEVAVQLELDTIPILEGARQTIQEGFTSSLHPQNLGAANYLQNPEQVSDSPSYPLLFDPQTAGGLLAAIPPDKAGQCLKSLHNSGYKQARIIGQVIPRNRELMPVQFKL